MKKKVATSPLSFGKIITIVSLLLAVVFSSPTFAHKYYSILTRVNHNTQVGSLEIVHRFFADDIEKALSFERGQEIRFDDGSEIEPYLRAYVEKNFEMSEDNIIILPNWIGYEVEGDNLWVYQEQMIEHLPKSFHFLNTLLIGVFPDQVNTVTLTLSGFRSSLSFMAGATEGSLDVN